MSIALVLEGGAKRAIYTAGVLDVLLEHNIIVDGVIGTSAGAIHGCTYVAFQKGRGIRYNIKYCHNYKFMSLKSWIKTGNVVDKQFAYHDLPEKLDPVDNETFKKMGIKLYAVSTNIETGKAEYKLCTDMFKDIDYIRASASLPLFSKIVTIDKKKYLDGGIADSIPLKASQNLGFNKNIVVLTRPFGYRKKKSIISNFLIKIFYKKYPNFVKASINRYKTYNEQLDFIESEEKKGNILVIRPSKLIKIKKMEQNISIIKDMYNLGKSDTENLIDKIRQFIKNS